MRMSNEAKQELLLKNFDIIKDNYNKNHIGMASVVVKMLKIDINTAVDMWSYLVTKHASKVKSEDSWSLTGRIMYEGGNAIGEEQMEEVVLKNQVLKKALFAQACDDVRLFVSKIISRSISTNDLQTADELLALVYKNKYRNNSWYEIMDNIIPDDPDDMNVTAEAYELLEMWCDKVKDPEERAKLSIKMIEYID